MTARALAGRIARPRLAACAGAASCLLAVALGTLAGYAPLIALLAAAALALGALMLADLVVAAAAFTVLQSFALVQELPVEQGNVVKAAGALLAIAWLMSVAHPARARADGLLQRQPALVAALVAFLAWGGLSLLWAPDAGLVMDTLLRHVPNALLLAMIFTAASTRRGAVWIIVALGLGAALAAAVNAITGGDREDEGRLAGTLANELAEALIPGAILLAAIAAWSIGGGRRVALGSLAAVCASALFLTLSRGGIIALGVALLAWAAFGGRWRPRLAGACAAVVVVAIGYFAFAAAPEARDRVMSLTGESALASEGGSGRTDLWNVAWRMTEANPLAGVGLGNFTEASPRYLQEPGLVRRSDLFLETPKTVHNTYLEVLAEGGPLALALFLAVLALPLVATARAARLFERGGDARMELLSRALFAATVGVLVANVFISGQHQHVLWILLGLGPASLLLAGRSSSPGAHS